MHPNMSREVLWKLKADSIIEGQPLHMILIELEKRTDYCCCLFVDYAMME